MLEQAQLVGDIVQPDGRLRTINASETVAAAAREMRERGISSLIVVSDDDHIVGIVTERDIVSKVVAEHAYGDAMMISDIMTTNVLGCSLKTRLSKAAQVMAEHKIRHIPVISDGVPVAMISSRDILASELSASRSMLQRQADVIGELEAAHPGIRDLERTASGRIVI